MNNILDGPRTAMDRAALCVSGIGSFLFLFLSKQVPRFHFFLIKKELVFFLPQNARVYGSVFLRFMHFISQIYLGI